MEDTVPLEMPANPRGEPIHQHDDRVVHDGLVDRLLAVRSDWAAERVRHKFLLDAYAGTGGFQGKVRLPFASYWGWAADVYHPDLPLSAGVDTGMTEQGIETYLDRFTREDVQVFQRRVNVSHYPNYVSTFVDVPLSYMFRKEFHKSPDEQDSGQLGVWESDADGAGTDWSDIVRDTIVPRASVLGWCPVLFDLPSSGTRLPTAFDDQRSQRMPYVVPLFPSNLLDWSHDENGVLRWVKTRMDYVDREGPLEPSVDVTRITMWFPDRWQWFELIKAKDNRATIRAFDEGTHPFGRVPLLVLPRKPIPDDPFRGIPLAGSASEEARRMFNYISELDDFMRKCAFAFLEFPTANPAQEGNKVLGSGNALPVKPDWGNTHRWVIPETNVADMYERRIATTIEEMYRSQKMEFTRGQRGGNARSGVSQAFEFEAANRSIAEIARMVARFDQEARRMVASVLPSAPDREKIVTKAPARFDVEEMAKELDEALSSVSLGLGPTAEAEIKKKVVRSQLPHLDDEKWIRIEQEIDEMAEQRAQQQRDLSSGDIREARQALRGNRDDPEDILDLREEQEDEDGEQ